MARVLPHNNRRCVAPPGELRPGSGKPVIVSSIMRSGTHLLIDLLLNNFPAYRRMPLYVDLDHALASGLTAADLLHGGCYVMKSHHPNVRYAAAAQAELEELAAAAFIPETEVKKSIVWR